ncbi:PIR Superfamily Protein [Plasmodium ovale curtisi]|nr:PIR Superfamily Protein [Plasmodium ovale curtisi]SBS99920.1 PIR Superfamily Protein [Plasmodium ovale curtisi]
MAAERSHGGPGEFSEMYLSALPSKKFYNDMTKNYEDLSNYSQQCEQIIVSKNNNEVKEICKKYLRYLEKNYTLWNKVISGYDVCILLNYWIYDTLTGIYGPENNSDIINIAFSNLQLVLGYLNVDSTKKSFYERCKPNYEMFKHKDWDKRKELYEYYIDYTTIKQQSDIFDKQCKNFYEYIEGKKSLYKHFQDLCISDSSSCPKFYDECLSYNPDSVLRTIKCHGQIVSERAAAEADAKPPDVQHDPVQELGSEPDSSSTELKEGNSQIGKKVGHSVLGVAPVLLTATALYRYTPIGSWIRKLRGTNPNSINDMEGFSTYTQESGDMFSDNTGNYISYQPI